MASEVTNRLVASQDAIAHRVSRRSENQRKATELKSVADGDRFVELACECRTVDCERTVKVPLYVYRRMLDSGNQYLLQAGHHAFASYRTIISIGLMRIEERV